VNYSNQQSSAVNLDEIVTAEDLLAKLRKGNEQKLEIGLGDLKIPVRLINAKEESTIIAKAEIKALKDTPQGNKKDIFEAQQIMKDLLYSASQVHGSPGLPMRFLEALSHKELTTLFDQYVSLNNTINPNIQDLSESEIAEIVDGLKKKQKTVNDLYSWQLAALGRFFATKVLPLLQTANEPGLES